MQGVYPGSAPRNEVKAYILLLVVLLESRLQGSKYAWPSSRLIVSWVNPPPGLTFIYTGQVSEAYRVSAGSYNVSGSVTSFTCLSLQVLSIHGGSQLRAFSRLRAWAYYKLYHEPSPCILVGLLLSNPPWWLTRPTMGGSYLVVISPTRGVIKLLDQIKI